MNRFESRYLGARNLGLRVAIREAAEAAMPCCAAVMRRAIVAVARRVPLHTADLTTLAQVAEDYAAMRKVAEPRCACAMCAGVYAQQGVR